MPTPKPTTPLTLNNLVQMFATDATVGLFDHPEDFTIGMAYAAFISRLDPSLLDRTLAAEITTWQAAGFAEIATTIELAAQTAVTLAHSKHA